MTRSGARFGGGGVRTSRRMAPMLRRAWIAGALVVVACETFTEAPGRDDAGGGQGGEEGGAATDAAADAGWAGEGGVADATVDAGGNLIVFVTGSSYANVQSAAEADTRCNEEAEGRLPGRFVAWFSETLEVPHLSAPERLFTSKGVAVDGPWHRVDGKRVVASRAALGNTATTPLENPIDVSASGTPRTGSAWTATYADGGIGELCSGANPTKGLVTATDTRWTEEGDFTATCTSALSLYCFQVE